MTLFLCACDSHFHGCASAVCPLAALCIDDCVPSSRGDALFLVSSSSACLGIHCFAFALTERTDAHLTAYLLTPLVSKAAATRFPTLIRSGAAMRRRMCATCVASPLGVLLPLLVWCACMTDAFVAVPVNGYFVRSDTSGDKEMSIQRCAERGGTLAAEPTSVAHSIVIEQAQKAGKTDVWYAYLGSSLWANPHPNNCPAPGRGAYGSTGCYWRWDQGRWPDMVDDESLEFFMLAVGVTHFIGNFYSIGGEGARAVGGFPSYFPGAGASFDVRRPNVMAGNDLLAVGAPGGTSTWSDNLAIGGYTYAGAQLKELSFSQSVFSSSAQAETTKDFLAICVTYTPSRAQNEVPDTSSTVEKNWWVILFVLVFVTCTIIFIVIACCQDREGTGLPEDAPEWVEDESRAAKRTRSYISQRSFRSSAGEEGDAYERTYSDRSGSSASRSRVSDEERETSEDGRHSNSQGLSHGYG